MKKLIGIIFLSTVAMVTVLATPQGNAQAWWTDFGPNIAAPDTEVTGGEETEPEVTSLWWTDHGPNH